MTHPYRYLFTGDVPVPLIDDLCRWHDRMVAHTRRVGAAPGQTCCDDRDDCPRTEAGPLWARAFGFVALIFACINIFGGFLVTQRMLAMYKKKQK